MTARVAIVGAGHVGIVYAGGLAKLGHTVTVVDIDAQRIELLRRGQLWFHEPGLPELVHSALAAGRLSFTTSYGEALDGAMFVFVCVPTPTTADGSLDDSMLRSAFQKIRSVATDPPPLLVNKSTVPVGTGNVAAELFGADGLRVVSNPEFLAEGRAVHDFFHPSRIVLGARRSEDADAVASLFQGIDAPIVRTDNTTAEFSKLASNAFLATKISFANAIGVLAEAVHADTAAVGQVLSLDPRIGEGHMRAGLGFGGSCLPKDVAAVEHMASKHDAHPELFAAVSRINSGQRRRVVDFLIERFGAVADKRIAILGIAFKPDTDDTRESPGALLADELLALHADVRAHDPVARPRLSSGRELKMCRTATEAVRDVDAVIIATEWPEYGRIDLRAVRAAMREPVLIDGRGVISREAAEAAGLEYFSLAASKP